MSPEANSAPPMTGVLFKSSLWAAGMRWGIHLLGLVSTAFLARLLTPEDFGLVAMAMAALALVETLTYFGVELALIRNKNAGRAELDTAWTIRLIQLGLVAIAIFLAAPLAAAYYGDPRLTDILRVDRKSVV